MLSIFKLPSVSRKSNELARDWKQQSLKTPLYSATLDLVLYYLKHLFLHSVLLARKSFSGTRNVRRHWGRLNKRMTEIILECLNIELNSGIDIQRSKSALQIFQMLESASADSGHCHFRIFSKLIIGCVKVICAPKSPVSASNALQITEKMISLLGTAYPKVSGSSLRRFFLTECYRLIHERAGVKGEIGVLTKIQLIFQTQNANAISDPNISKTNLAGSVAYYKGQYGKAIYLWTKQVLDPRTEPNVKEKRLLSILYTLFQTQSIRDSGVRISNF